MLSIGQFSKVCGVSIQTLRYYDQINLISPCKVDAENSYRYYDVSQITELLLISRLKRYGFSLVQIQSLLQNRDTAKQLDILQQQQYILSKDVMEQQIALQELEQHIQKIKQGENLMSYPINYTVTIVERKPQTILSHRQMMSIDDFGKYFGLLFQQMETEHLVPSGQTISIYHDSEFNPENSDIEVAVPIVEKEKATRILDGGQFAHTIHYGAYSRLADAYGSVTEWIEQNGYQINGAPFEIYEKSNMTGLSIDQWETSIYFPVIKK